MIGTISQPETKRVAAGFLDHPKTVWWRKWLFQVHLWVGVAIGLYVIAICVSGSILVFEQELLNYNYAPQVGSDLNHGSSSYQQMADTALQAHPGDTLVNIDMQRAERRLVPVGLDEAGRDRVVWIDSSTGRIVHDEVLQESHHIVELLLQLHNRMLGGSTTERLNGIGGALLFLLSVTGIVIWWPGRKHWSRGMKVKWNARWARLNLDLHYAFGFWTLVLVGMWGFTGAYFIFPQPFLRAIQVFSPTPHRLDLPSEWKPGELVLPVDAYVDKAQRMYPGAQLAYLSLDVHRPGGTVQVYLTTEPGVTLSRREDVVTFQPATLEVLSNFDSTKWTAGERLPLLMRSIHFGDFGGMLWKVLWSIAGLIPILLVITGYVMWWNRVLKKKWRQLRDPASS